MLQQLIIGTRRSKLALWQTECVRQALRRACPGLQVEVREIVTQGDKNLEVSLASIGGKGLFTAELEQELLRQGIDIAVHSLKDLPTENDPRFILGAILARDFTRDVLVSRDKIPLSKLRSGAVVGTCSPRREAQLRRLRPDAQFKDIRGNVDTRVRKVMSGEYDATVLAEAGLARLGLTKAAAQYFTADEVMPAPGQGALAVQCAAARSGVIELLACIDSLSTRIETTAERAFLETLAAGCSTPVGALAVMSGGRLALRGRCLSHDGARSIEVSGECEVGSQPVRDAQSLGAGLADEALAQGFRTLL